MILLLGRSRKIMWDGWVLVWSPALQELEKMGNPQNALLFLAACL